jgi:6-phosphogluconolactonase
MHSQPVISPASDSEIADWLEVRLGAALDGATGSVAITVPGGATPFPILAELGTRTLDWQRIAVWPSDERCVMEDHPASNLGRIRAVLGQTGARIIPLSEGEMWRC